MFVDPRLRHAILHDLAVRAGALRDPDVLLRDRRRRGNVAEVLLDFLPRRFRRDVAGQHDDRVVGAVIGAEPLLHVLDRCGVEVLHRPDHGPRIGMTRRVRALRHQEIDFPVGLILPLPFLVLHDAALLVHLRRIDHPEQVAHPVRFHPQRDVERAGRDVFEIVGAVVVGRAVLVRRADALERLEVVVVEVLAAVEHQMLEQMREPRAAGLLILGTHVVPDVHGDDGRLVVLVHQQRQAVFQNEPLVRDRNWRRRCGCDASPRGANGPPTLGGHRRRRREPQQQGQ